MLPIGCAFTVEMRQDVLFKQKLCDRVSILIRKLSDRVSCGRKILRVLLKQWMMYASLEFLCEGYRV